MKLKLNVDELLTKEPQAWLSEHIAKTQPVPSFSQYGNQAPLIQAIYAFDRYKNLTRLYDWFAEILSPEDLYDLVKEAIHAHGYKEDRKRLIEWLAPRLSPEEMHHIENFLRRHIRTKEEGRPPQPSYLMHPKEALARPVRDRVADMIDCGEARNKREAKPKAIDEILSKFSHFRVSRSTLANHLNRNFGDARKDWSGPDRPLYPPTKKARQQKRSRRT
jgi:hypothetical protein